MSKFDFLFDLDSVITQQDIYSFVTNKTEVLDHTIKDTRKFHIDSMPFKQFFLDQIILTKNIPVSHIGNIVSKIDLNTKIIEFIKQHKSRCFIFSYNLDVWIHELMNKLNLGVPIFSSKALVNNEDKFQNICYMLDEENIIKQMVNPFVVIGNGNHNVELMEAAVVKIGFGGTNPISPAILEYASHAAYEEETLVRILNKLL